MLVQLNIQNYALIEQLNLSLGKKLTIITGETGAGKSIVLGALNLILGARADSQVLFNKEKKCVVEAVFDISSYNLSSFFLLHELDFDNRSIIRREISKDGKSRAFINDTPVNLSVLKELTEQLVDIHSQRDSLALISADYRMYVPDAFAGNQIILDDYKKKLTEFRKSQSNLNELISSEKQAKANLDYLQFQFNEIESANFVAGEKESVEQELELLNNAEEIKNNFAKSFAAINDEQGLLSILNDLIIEIKNASKHHKPAGEFYNRLNSVLIEIKDISSEIERFEQEIIYDPERIDFLNDRLSLIYKLLKKHNLISIEELIQLRDKLSLDLKNISSLDEQIAQLQLLTENQKHEVLNSAKQLSEKRKSVIPEIEKKVQLLLKELSMNDARLKINLQSTNEFHANGMDEMEWLFSANKGHDYKNIVKVASGGELSRLMLCIKAMMAEVLELPTMIFDEIDTGVSGEVAIQVGRMMSKIAEQHQVITITHLPQIAGKGHSHFYVYKETDSKITHTRVRELNKEERISEIAKMIGGEQPTDSAYSSAREMLN